MLGERRITFHSLIRLIPRNSGNGLIQFTNWAQKIQTDHVSHSIRPIMDRNSQIFGDSINWMNITNEDQIAFSEGPLYGNYVDGARHISLSLLLTCTSALCQGVSRQTVPVSHGHNYRESSIIKVVIPAPDTQSFHPLLERRTSAPGLLAGGQPSSTRVSTRHESRDIVLSYHFLSAQHLVRSAKYFKERKLICLKIQCIVSWKDNLSQQRKVWNHGQIRFNSKSIFYLSFKPIFWSDPIDVNGATTDREKEQRRLNEYADYCYLLHAMTNVSISGPVSMAATLHTAQGRAISVSVIRSRTGSASSRRGRTRSFSPPAATASRLPPSSPPSSRTRSKMKPASEQMAAAKSLLQLRAHQEEEAMDTEDVREATDTDYVPGMEIDNSQDDSRGGRGRSRQPPEPQSVQDQPRPQSPPQPQLQPQRQHQSQIPSSEAQAIDRLARTMLNSGYTGGGNGDGLDEAGTCRPALPPLTSSMAGSALTTGDTRSTFLPASYEVSSVSGVSGAVQYVPVPNNSPEYIPDVASPVDNVVSNSGGTRVTPALSSQIMSSNIGRRKSKYETSLFDSPRYTNLFKLKRVDRGGFDPICRRTRKVIRSGADIIRRNLSTVHNVSRPPTDPRTGLTVDPEACMEFYAQYISPSVGWAMFADKELQSAANFAHLMSSFLCQSHCLHDRQNSTLFQGEAGKLTFRECSKCCNSSALLQKVGILVRADQRILPNLDGSQAGCPDQAPGEGNHQHLQPQPQPVPHHCYIGYHAAQHPVVGPQHVDPQPDVVPGGVQAPGIPAQAVNYQLGIGANQMDSARDIYDFSNSQYFHPSLPGYPVRQMSPPTQWLPSTLAEMSIRPGVSYTKNFPIFDCHSSGDEVAGAAVSLVQPPVAEVVGDAGHVDEDAAQSVTQVSNSAAMSQWELTCPVTEPSEMPVGLKRILRDFNEKRAQDPAADRSQTSKEILDTIHSVLCDTDDDRPDGAPPAPSLPTPCASTPPGPPPGGWPPTPTPTSTHLSPEKPKCTDAPSPFNRSDYFRSEDEEDELEEGECENSPDTVSPRVGHLGHGAPDAQGVQAGAGQDQGVGVETEQGVLAPEHDQPVVKSLTAVNVDALNATEQLLHDLEPCLQRVSEAINVIDTRRDSGIQKDDVKSVTASNQWRWSVSSGTSSSKTTQTSLSGERSRSRSSSRSEKRPGSSRETSPICSQHIGRRCLRIMSMHGLSLHTTKKSSRRSARMSRSRSDPEDSVSFYETPGSESARRRDAHASAVFQRSNVHSVTPPRRGEVRSPSPPTRCSPPRWSPGRRCHSPSDPLSFSSQQGQYRHPRDKVIVPEVTTIASHCPNNPRPPGPPGGQSKRGSAACVYPSRLRAHLLEYEREWPVRHPLLMKYMEEVFIKNEKRDDKWRGCFIWKYPPPNIRQWPAHLFTDTQLREARSSEFNFNTKKKNNHILHHGPSMCKGTLTVDNEVVHSGNSHKLFVRIVTSMRALLLGHRDANDEVHVTLEEAARFRLIMYHCAFEQSLRAFKEAHCLCDPGEMLLSQSLIDRSYLDTQELYEEK